MLPLSPTTLAELVDVVRSTPRLLAVGARTKPRLSQVEDDVALLSMHGLSGIIEYDPSEFTFTALAGTPVREIAAALAERGQYLPFDPLFLDAGATLGGTVAAGLSGPGRFRFGGVRNFILGVRFVDGAGRLLRLGGKVVKNAAGFDVPKFMVGSLGRFGVLAEITFKVFPRPTSTLTLKLTLNGIEDAARVLTEAANTRWELDALDALPDGKSVLLRLAAPEAAMAAIAREILARWPGETLSAAEAATVWSDIGEFRWVHPGQALIKVVITAAQLPPLHHAARSVNGMRIHVSAGGDVAYVSSLDGVAVDGVLRELGLRGMTLQGIGPIWRGIRQQTQIARAVKKALDPQGRFPALDD
jgi:glycolate oxidase FAD binding subunit